MTVYAHLSLIDIVKRGSEARQKLDAEADPLKRRVYERQYRELQDEWRARNAVTPPMEDGE